jgi:OPA family glycerol-3-phosphate transporter-like MFS transporter
MAACGFFVYGPLMLVSVAAAGYVGPELAGSSSGLAGLFGYIGATLAGVGLGATAQYAGWPAAFAVLAASSLLSALCFGYTARAAANKVFHDNQSTSTS